MVSIFNEITIKHLAPTYYTRYRESIRICNRKGLILNLGCKDDKLCKEFLSKKNKVVGCDFYLKNIKNDRLKRMSFVLGNAEELPFKKNKFDAVICIDVIEHVENEKQTVREIFRVLKKNGQLVLSTVNENFPFTYDPMNYLLKTLNTHVPIGIWGFGHKRTYKVKELKKLLQKNGFRIKKIKFLTHFLAGLFENYISEILKPLSESKFTDNMSALTKYFLPITKLIVSHDNKFFRTNEKSVSILISAYKKG